MHTQNRQQILRGNFKFIIRRKTENVKSKKNRRKNGKKKNMFSKHNLQIEQHYENEPFQKRLMCSRRVSVAFFMFDIRHFVPLYVTVKSRIKGFLFFFKRYEYNAYNFYLWVYFENKFFQFLRIF